MSWSKVKNHNELIHEELQAAKEKRQPNFVSGLRFDQRSFFLLKTGPLELTGTLGLHMVSKDVLYHVKVATLKHNTSI